jgi:hypothetical protein
MKKHIRHLNRVLIVVGALCAVLGLRCKEEPTEVVAGVASVAAMTGDSITVYGRQALAWILDPQQELVAYLLLTIFVLVLLSTVLSPKQHTHRP